MFTSCICAKRSGRRFFALISILVLGMVCNISIAEESKHMERPVLKVCADPELMPFSNKNEGQQFLIQHLLFSS